MPENKLKIFVDAHSLDTEYQGTQTFIIGLYTAMMENYKEYDYYFGAVNKDAIKRAFPSLPDSNILLYRYKRTSLRLSKDIPRLITIHDFDFAHFQYISPFNKNHKCRYIVTLHDILFKDFPEYFPWIYRKSRNYFFKRSIKNADIKTTVSDYSRGRIAYHYNVSKEEIHVIPNGIRNISVTGESKKNSKKYLKEKYGLGDFILYVSRIEPRKNHISLLNAYLELALYKKYISLVFIGKKSLKVGSLSRKMASLTDEQKKYVVHIDQVTHPELDSFLQACKLFAFPSKAEGFGIPPLEAIEAEVPVLCSDTTNMKEFDFLGASFFDPDNNSELKEKMRGILSAPPSEAELKNKANIVKNEYSWKNSAAKFNKLIQQ